MDQNNRSQLNNPLLLDNTKSRAQKYITHWQLPEAKDLADQIEGALRSSPNLATENPEISREYAIIVLWLRLASFFLYDNATCLALIKNNFLDAAKLGLDFNELMNAKMYSIPDLAWPDFANECIGALKANIQQLGKRLLQIKGEEKTFPPSIKNWLIDYDRLYGADKHTDLQRGQYLSQNINTRGLSEQEKKWLSILLRFYDNLKPIPRSQLGDLTTKQAPPSLAPPQSPTANRIAPNLPSALPRPSVPSQGPLANPTLQSDVNLRSALPQKENTETTAEPLPSQNRQSHPRIEGNIVDLKN